MASLPIKAGFLLALLAGCTHHLRIPAPALPIGAPLPEPPPSTIDLPVEADLTAARGALEDEVPHDVNAMGAWTMVAGDRIGIKYHATRGDFGLAFRGANLDASVAIRYQAEACVRQKKPWPLSGYVCPKVASCGEGEPWPELDVATHTSLAWSPDWHLESHTTTSLGYPRHCLVTFLHYDVTPQLDRVFRPRLDGAAHAIDARIAAVTNLRDRAGKVWELLWKPIQVAPDAWLLVRPAAFRVAPFNGQGLHVSTSIGVEARPVLVIGAPPEPAPAPPLPELAIAPPGNGFYVALRGELTYAAANEALHRQLIGKSFTVSGHVVEVRSAEVLGVHDVAVVKLAIVAKTGWLRHTAATLYLTGVPQYDLLTKTLSLSGLDYSIETRRALVAIDWLLHGRFVALVQARARWSLGDQLAVARQRLEAALNRTIGSVALAGHVDDVRLVGVLTSSDRFVVYAEARGAARITVTPTLRGGRP